MIQSFFFAAATGEVLIEKHWRSVTPRTILAHFLSHVDRCGTKEEVPPVITYSGYYIFSVLRDGNFLIATTTVETSPLLVMEFLDRVHSIFVDYFGATSETVMKDNFATVYQLLEEMMDYGYPLLTEPNALKSMIKPPTLVDRFTNAVSREPTSNISDMLPDGTISNMPWRKDGVVYSQNEIFVDIIEEIDAIVDSRGGVVSSEVMGVLATNSRLSGVPDITLTFKDPDLIDDCSFHPCVRYNRFERDKALSFVPPDGTFELMRYRVSKKGHVTAPVYVQPSFVWDRQKPVGTLSLTVGMKAVSSLIESKMNTSLSVEDLVVTLPFSKSVRTIDSTTDVGTVLFDETTKILKWIIGPLDQDKVPQMTGSMHLEEDALKNESPVIQLEWKVMNASFSGMSLSSLQITNESYKPFKGMRSIAKSGNYQIRSHI